MLYFYSSNNNLQIYLPKLNLTACVGVGGKEVTEKATPPRHVAEVGRQPGLLPLPQPPSDWLSPRSQRAGEHVVMGISR